VSQRTQSATAQEMRTLPTLSPTSSQNMLPPNSSFSQYRSLRTYLLICFSALIILIGTLAGFGVYHSTHKEALKLQDHYLEMIALLISDEHGAALPTYSAEPKFDSKNNYYTVLKLHFEKEGTELQEAQIVIQPINVQSPTVQQKKAEASWLQLPAHIVDGLSTIESNGDEWRVFVRTLPNHQRFLVGQQTEVRDELATYTSLRMLIPLVILFPTLLLVMMFVIRQAFQPITQLTRQIDQQEDSAPLELNSLKIPREILPFVHSINRLLARL